MEGKEVRVKESFTKRIVHKISSIYGRFLIEFRRLRRIGKKWWFIPSLALAIGAFYVAWLTHKKNIESRFAHNKCIGIFIMPQATISVDSFQRIKFGFNRPWFRKVNDSVNILYRLRLYDSTIKKEIDLPEKDFTLEDLKRTAIRNGLKKNYIYLNQIFLVLRFQNIGETSQFSTHLTVHFWKKHQWKEAKSGLTEEMNEIPSGTQSYVSFPVSYPGGWLIPKRFYFKVLQSYTTAFGQKKSESGILVLDTRKYDYAVINEKQFVEYLKADSTEAVAGNYYPNY